MKRAAVVLGCVGMLAAAIWMWDRGVSPLAAQDAPPREPPRAGPEGEMRRPFMPGGAMMQGSMVTVGKHIFVLMGGTLYKVDPDTMEVVKTLELVKRDDLRPRERAGENPGSDRTRRPPQ